MYCDMDANSIYCFKCGMQVVYILDQVRALENEMVFRMQKQGLDVDPNILIVSLFVYFATCCVSTSLSYCAVASLVIGVILARSVRIAFLIKKR